MTRSSRPILHFLPLMEVLFLIPLSCGIAGAAVIHVPAQFSTIQEAVDVAQVGDDIELDANYYSEDVTVTKEVTIRGANADISAGSHSGKRGGESLIENSCFVITASNVVIEGLLFRGGSEFLQNDGKHAIVVSAAGVCIQNSIFENVVGEQSSAILAKANQSDDLLVEGCSLRGNTCALRLEQSRGGTIRGNRIEADKVGVLGIEMENVSDLGVAENCFAGHSRAAWVIRKAGSGIVAQRNQFEGDHLALIHEGGEVVDLRNCCWGDRQGPKGKIRGTGETLSSPWSEHALFSDSQTQD